MNDFFNRLRSLFGGTSHPEYREYRDERAPSPMSPEEARFNQVKLLGSVILLITVPLSLYLFFVKRPQVVQPASMNEVRQAEAARALQGMDPLTGKRETKEDIQEWAAQIEAEAHREIGDADMAAPATGRTDIGYSMPEEYHSSDYAPAVPTDPLSASDLKYFDFLKSDTALSSADENTNMASAEHSADIAAAPGTGNDVAYQPLSGTNNDYREQYTLPSSSSPSRTADAPIIVSTPQGNYYITADQAREVLETINTADSQSPQYGSRYRPRRYEPRTYEPKEVGRL